MGTNSMVRMGDRVKWTSTENDNVLRGTIVDMCVMFAPENKMSVMVQIENITGNLPTRHWVNINAIEVMFRDREKQLEVIA